MRQIIKIAMLVPAVLSAAHGQTSGKAEFEVASIKSSATPPGFHFAADAATGGPGTVDPGMFRCSRCSVATLIVKAFNLQPYQFPGRTSLTDNTYEIVAKIPAGATAEESSAMLQNLLKDRFGLTWHFQEKKMKGYHLAIAKDGPKLRESGGAPLASAAEQHRFGQAESHNHSGPVVFGSSATYRAANQTMADLARMLSDQTGLPIDDETALQASTIFPCAGPARGPSKPAITEMAPGPAAPDTPATRGEAGTRPAGRPTPPARPSSTLSSSNSA
jgi:uncharacterized protein (TIGR03435 family)